MAYSALPNLDNLNNREWVKLTDGLDNVISFCQISRSINVVTTAGSRSTASGLPVKSVGLMVSFIIPSPSILEQISRSISVVRTAGNRSTASGLLMKSAGLMTSFIIPSPSILVQFVMA
ncbi:unnamed protein product [Rotaria sordida]|uniref:Uncharacterized protein n=1 Tax=Rotaria sordida TaxID=392033 RepID=A0A814LN76_9BILA|nr:unnamed protein product [Rotaria sordida]